MSVSGIRVRKNKRRLSLQKELFLLTGYCADELAKVEYAFERAAKIDIEEYHLHTEQELIEDQFNGLQAVMDVMLGLDEIANGQQYKDKFKEHPKLQIA